MRWHWIRPARTRKNDKTRFARVLRTGPTSTALKRLTPALLKAGCWGKANMTVPVARVIAGLLMGMLIATTQAAEPVSARSAAGVPAEAGPPPPGMFAPAGRSITHVAGDLYRANNGGWYVAFLVTPAGIVLVDTLNPDFARWLKAQLAQRFPGKVVKLRHLQPQPLGPCRGRRRICRHRDVHRAGAHVAQHGRALPRPARGHRGPQR